MRRTAQDINALSSLQQIDPPTSESANLKTAICSGKEYAKLIQQNVDAKVDSKFPIATVDLVSRTTEGAMKDDAGPGADVDESVLKCVTFMSDGNDRKSVANAARNTDEDQGDMLDWTYLERNTKTTLSAAGVPSLQSKQEASESHQARDLKAAASSRGEVTVKPAPTRRGSAGTHLHRDVLVNCEQELETEDCEHSMTPRSSSSYDSPSEDFLRNTLKECRDSIIPATGALFTSHGSSTTSSGTRAPSALPTPSSSYHKAESRKRLLNRDDEDNEHDGFNRDFRRPKLGLSERSVQGAQRGRRLACHLHPFDPQKYCKNSETGKKYDICAGPGWLNVNHLKQHLGISASSVHMNIRCPLCHQIFQSEGLVLDHQEAEPPECLSSQPPTDSDDIAKSLWNKIKLQVSLKSFDHLPKEFRDDIDTWVSKNVVAYAPNREMPFRTGELKKWYMIWKLLYSTADIPPHPFYDTNPTIPATNRNILVKAFRERVESAMAAGEMDALTEEQSIKLQVYLREAIQRASGSTAAATRLLSESTEPQEHCRHPSISSPTYLYQIFNEESSVTSRPSRGTNVSTWSPSPIEPEFAEPSSGEDPNSLFTKYMDNFLESYSNLEEIPGESSNLLDAAEYDMSFSDADTGLQ